jgi:hypothetical protein
MLMLVASAFFGFRGVAIGSFCTHFVKRFDAMNEGDVSFNVFPSCLNIILLKFFFSITDSNFWWRPSCIFSVRSLYNGFGMGGARVSPDPSVPSHFRHSAQRDVAIPKAKE